MSAGPALGFGKGDDPDGLARRVYDTDAGEAEEVVVLADLQRYVLMAAANRAPRSSRRCS